MSHQSQMLKEQEVMVSESRQHCVVLESQLEAAREEAERLQANVSMYKLRFEQTNTQLQHAEVTAASLREKLQDSRAQAS